MNTHVQSPESFQEIESLLEEVVPLIQSVLEGEDGENSDIREDISSVISDLHPSVLVELTYNLDEQHQDEFLQHITGLDSLSDLVAYANIPLRTKLLTILDDPRLAAVIRRVDVDDAADILSLMTRRRQVKVLKRLKPSLVKEITTLLAYESETAGGIMTPRFVPVSPSENVGDALARITQFLRDGTIDTDTDLSNLFVLDENRKLVGVIPFRKLLASDASSLLSDVVEDDVIYAYANEDQEEVARRIADYDIVSLPVLSQENGEMLGVITVDDILDVIEEEHAEDISRLVGTEQGDTVGASTLIAVKSRLPWLVVTWAGGTIGAAVLGNFSSYLEKVVALAFFMPVVFGMGGNVGSQSSTITVRGLATGELGLMRVRERLRKEAQVGIFLGVFFGVLLSLASYFMFGDRRLSIVVASSIFFTISCASVFGAGLPVIFERLKLDPAVASGPLVTTMTDMVSIVIYFSIAHFLI